MSMNMVIMGLVLRGRLANQRLIIREWAAVLARI